MQSAADHVASAAGDVTASVVQGVVNNVVGGFVETAAAGAPPVVGAMVGATACHSSKYESVLVSQTAVRAVGRHPTPQQMEVWLGQATTPI